MKKNIETQSVDKPKTMFVVFTNSPYTAGIVSGFTRTQTEADELLKWCNDNPIRVDKPETNYIREFTPPNWLKITDRTEAKDRRPSRIYVIQTFVALEDNEQVDYINLARNHAEAEELSDNYRYMLRGYTLWEPWLEVDENITES